MFISGRANTLIEFQNPTGDVDSQGAPDFTWIASIQMYAYPENEITALDSMASGPREEATRTLTFVTRNYPNSSINTRQRVVVVDTGEVFRVLAIRYDVKQTTCFIDVQGGESNG